MGARERILLEIRRCEFAHGVGEEFLLVGEVEIHPGLVALGFGSSVETAIAIHL